jgi:GTP-binding protein HflX
VAISALRGDGISALLQAVSEKLYATYEPIVVDLPYEEGGLIALFHEMGQVEEVQHHRGGVRIRGRVPGRLVARYAPFVTRVGTEGAA